MAARENDGRATIADVARLAGVSQATASRALTGGPASPAARARVEAAAARLDYAPHPLARSLASGAGSRIVVAVAGNSPAALADPHVARVVAAAAAVADPAGLGVTARWVPRRSAGELGRDLAADRSVAGVVLVNSTPALLAAVPARLRPRTAAVGVGGHGVPGFDVDSGGAVRALLHHLLSGGRRRPVLVAGPSWLPAAQRPGDAFTTALREAGLPVRTVRGDFSARGGAGAARQAVRRWPDTDAVVAVNDATALGVLTALHALSVRVPDDVAVTGFDDVPFAALARPALTTATHPVEAIAAAATRAVLAGAASAPDQVLFGSVPVLRRTA